MPTLEWIGKDKVINHHKEVPFRVLEEKYTYNAEKSENMIIRGDNLEALKALLPQYEGKIKCIYIDPPYNTGNEKWVYNDNVNDPKIKKWLGEVVGKEGEDLSRHDKWLCMMYPRLRLLHKLLAIDGVIFISIDDNEQANLKLLCDEIFGTRNFVATILWQKIHSIKNDARYLSENHDFILIYAKNKDNVSFSLLERTDEMNNRYKNPDNDPRGVWQSGDLVAAEERTNGYYDVVSPTTGKIFNVPKGKHWVYSQENMEDMIADNRVWFGASGNSFPRKKRFLSEVTQGRKCTTWWTSNEVGHNQEAKREVIKIFDRETAFGTPKPTALISRIIQISMSEDDIILDSFAGSGTTAHAILNMNKADSGNRKFILVEMMDYAEVITAERVRRVISGYGNGNNAVEGTGGDFTFYDLGETLLLPNGNLNENVSIEKIREYVYYMETKETISDKINVNDKYFMGICRDTAYYFYYEKDYATTLSVDFLPKIKHKADGYVVYADMCAVSEKELKEWNITFKKIPRDIVRL